MAEAFTVALNWYDIRDEDDDPRWGYERALYAYLASATYDVLYIGKCYGTTVRRRHGYDAKSGVWDCIDRRTKTHGVIVAEFEMPDGMNLTGKLVADVECLLIYRTQPPCNRQCKASRGGYYRPGMRVVCRGAAWRLSARTFSDED